MGLGARLSTYYVIDIYRVAEYLQTVLKHMHAWKSP